MQVRTRWCILASAVPICEIIHFISASGESASLPYRWGSRDPLGVQTTLLARRVGAGCGVRGAGSRTQGVGHLVEDREEGLIVSAAPLWGEEAPGQRPVARLLPTTPPRRVTPPNPVVATRCTALQKTLPSKLEQRAAKKWSLQIGAKMGEMVASKMVIEKRTYAHPGLAEAYFRASAKSKYTAWSSGFMRNG